MRAAALLNLLQLASPALPVGAYCYSQGLESAIENGSVRDAAGARAWIAAHLREVLAQWEAPIFWRLLRAFAARDLAAASHWNDCFIASRESAEMRAETIQMGYSLGRLVRDLELCDPSMLDAQDELSLPAALACAANALDIPHEAAMLGMLFSWAENQVLVCVKSVPLGQVAGQRMLLALGPELEAAALHGQCVDDAGMSNWAPGLALLSMQHEVQYSRLYRS